MKFNMNKKTKIVFFGTPEFAVPTLQALHSEGFNICLVVTQPDKPVGRKQVLTPSPVKVEAEKMGLEIADDLKIKRLEDCNAEVGVVVAYGKIIPQEILNIFSKGCLNIHPSLLPKYRGPSPIQQAILNGEEETGVSIIKLDEQMDHGDIVSQIVYRVSDNDTSEDLHDKLAQKGAGLLVDTLPKYLSGEIKPVPQDDSKATFSKILKREDGEINWTKSADEIECQVRAYTPWPGSFAEFKTKDQGLRIKILSAKVSDDIEGEIGEFQTKNGQLVVRCGKGSLIIIKLQVEGKKEMSADEFINGYFK